jgi:hypothetical protein
VVSDPSFDAVLGGLGSTAVTALRTTLGDAWDGFSTQEKADAMGLMGKLARAHLYALAGQDTSEQLEILKIALEQWQVAGKAVVVAAMKQAATEVFGLGGAFAGSALAAFLKGGPFAI